jgi:hypothetical protein
MTHPRSTSTVRTVLRIGDLIYLDTLFSGLIPAKITGYTPNGEISVRITATRGAYQRGETTELRPQRCVPRTHVRVRRGQLRITGTWTFDGLPNEFQPQWA